ncbi:MAG TPA: LamB/YcsF family protein, partial [Dokdonella sp.]
LAVAHEAFADRRYEADGTLTPRREADAVIADDDAAIAQALAIARGEGVLARNGARLALHADTLCVHGDRAEAGAFARRLRAALDAAGIAIAAPAEHAR